MKRNMLLTSVLLSILTSIPVILLLGLGYRVYLLPFVPLDIFDFMVRVLPGFILIPAIHLMSNILLFFNVGSLSSVAKLAEQAMALLLFMAGVGMAGGILGLIALQRNRLNPIFAGALLGLCGTAFAAGMIAYLGFSEAGAMPSIIWTGFVLTGWGGITGWLLSRMYAFKAAAPTRLSVQRRSWYLLGASGAAVLSILVALVVFRTPPEAESPGMSARSVQQDTVTPAPDIPSAEILESRFKPVPGTRPEITPTDDFYRIDIVTRPPRIDGDTWRLEVSGLVDRPSRLSLDEIRAYPAVSQYATMSCISNPVGGPLISTGLWTGAPLIDLLEDLGVQPEARMLYIESHDGFYEIVQEEDLFDERTLLAYELNGDPLNAEQGFPLRIIIPNRYGMKQPKWITKMEVISENGVGFWVDRGWDEEAFVQLTSVIDVVDVDHPDPVTGAIPIGGIAYAGDRGISRVEVRIDDGDWVEVQLRTPPLGTLTWVQWRYDWPPESGSHTARVRAFDGAGEMQTPIEHEVFPSGATGYHMVNFEF